MPPKRKCQFKYEEHSQEYYANLSREEQRQEINGFRNFEGNGAGWSPLEAALFRLALTKYGCGNWDTCSYFLPHHNTAQFNTFSQKLFGQQSLAPFSGLKLDPYDVFLDICLKPTLRKNGVVVHEGAPKTTAQKKELKASWAERQKFIDNLSLPIVEDRARNYSKLLAQMDEMEKRVEKEILSRDGLTAEIDWDADSEEDLIFEEFLDQPTCFPQITEYEYDTELQCKRGQDNVWPLVRMVHDEEWYKADQVLHWNFVNGRCLLDAVAFDKSLQEPANAWKIKKGKDESRIHTAPKVKQKELPAEIIENDIEMKESAKEPQSKPLKFWTSEQVIDYLIETGMKPQIVETCRKNKISGKNIMEKGMQILEESGLESTEDEQNWSLALFRASKKK